MILPTIDSTSLAGVFRIVPRRFGDERGFFSESWNAAALAEAGLVLPDFVQDNHSLSRDIGTVRGLHFQSPPHAQGKLVRCGRGRLFDVAVDVRRGFMTLEPDTEIVYKVTDIYAPDCDGAVRWDSAGIDWPLTEVTPILSPKDEAAQALADFDSPFTWEAP
ncbi:MAG: dTDP-4-dehydrorhamnose 3,5-epimerase family protein [Maritimibacter sp.]